MDKERMEIFKQFTNYITYPMVVFEAETGSVLDMNHEAEQILGSKVEKIVMEPKYSLTKHNFWEPLHKRKSMMWNQICLKADDREYLVCGLINVAKTEDKYIYTLLFESQTANYHGNMTMESIVNRAGMVAIHMGMVEDGYQVEYISENVSQYGYTQEQLYRHIVTLEDLVCEEDTERVQESIVNAARQHAGESFVECRILTDEKELIPVRLLIYYIYDENDKLTGFEVLLMDLREEQRKNRENAYMNNVISKMKNVLIVKSYYQGKRSLKYISANAGILGMNAEALKKGYKLSEDYIYPEDRDGVIDSIYQAVANGVTDFTQTYRMVRDDGTKIWVANDVTVNRISDGEAEISFLLSDITEHKNMERELAAAAAGKEKAPKESRESSLKLFKLDKKDSNLLERFETMAGMLCRKADYYGVVLDTEGGLLTTPKGPTEYLGQFYDLFEREVFKEQFANIVVRVKEERIPQSVSFVMDNMEIHMIFTPIILEESVIAYWVLTSFAPDGAAILGAVVEKHWYIANDIIECFYSDQIIQNEKRQRKLAEGKLRREKKERQVIEDMLEALIRNGENSLPELFQKAGSYLFISDIGLYLENKETKSVEKYFVRNRLGEMTAFADRLMFSVSEYHVLKELFKKDPVLVVDRTTEELFLKELLRRTDMENMILLPLTSISGQKGYIVYANANKERPFDEARIAFAACITHIFESALPGGKKDEKKEIISEGFFEAYDHIRDAVFVKENQSGEIIFANKAMDNLFGFSLVGMHAGEVLNDQTEQYRHMHGMRKRFIANKKVTKWQSYMKELNQIMNIIEVHMEMQSGKDYSLYILKKNK
ncbi:MAG: PAS domain-containing protein [Lachnospiraceae bacterium]|nr:PAS domain-containing protein [Lachnospiraceae bacterium]